MDHLERVVDDSSTVYSFFSLENDSNEEMIQRLLDLSTYSLYVSFPVELRFRNVNVCRFHRIAIREKQSTKGKKSIHLLVISLLILKQNEKEIENQY